MAGAPFQMRRSRWFTEEQLARLHEAAGALLTEHGIRVLHSGARAAAARRGLRVSGDRVYPEASQVEAFTHARCYLPDSEPEPPDLGPIALATHCYTSHFHDLAGDELRPHTVESVTEATKLTDAMTEEGVTGAAPGAPQELPAELQQLAKYRIGACYSRHGKAPVAFTSALSMPYVIAMAETLGHRCRELGLFVVSPLTLGGEYLDSLLADPRWKSVGVSNMSSAGGTAPLRLAEALAFGVAEVVGAAIMVREISGLPVSWQVRVCPLDLRSMAFSLGSPEEVLFELANEEVNAFYQGRRPGPPRVILHTQAKLPTAQAAAERTCQMVTAGLLGGRSWGGAGTLSHDEVFSAEQLVLDVEMRDHVARLVEGVSSECDQAALLAEAAEGIRDGFLGLDRTVQEMRRLYWAPRLFERRSLSGWLGAGRPELRSRAREAVEARLKQFDYALDARLARELDRIYARAARELA